MGQPILIGHHSERHARKDAERIGYRGAMEQKTRLRNQETSSMASDELRRGRNSPRRTASGTEKA
jgi:hypothetical protein